MWASFLRTLHLVSLMPPLFKPFCMDIVNRKDHVIISNCFVTARHHSKSYNPRAIENVCVMISAGPSVWVGKATSWNADLVSFSSLLSLINSSFLDA